MSYTFSQRGKYCGVTVDVFYDPNSINMVFSLEQVDDTFSTILLLTHYFIPNWVMNLDNFPFFNSLLSPIIKMIISLFCFNFRFPALTLLWILYSTACIPYWSLVPPLLSIYSSKSHIWCWGFSIRLKHKNYPTNITIIFILVYLVLYSRTIYISSQFQHPSRNCV